MRSRGAVRSGAAGALEEEGAEEEAGTGLDGGVDGGVGVGAVSKSL
jgi:hypothetical protein